MARMLGLDVGERRIGVAISTPEGGLAVPLRVLESHGEADDAQAIGEIARAEQATALVVGYPLSLDGSAGPQAKRVEAFAGVLAKVTGLPLELWDERLSSVQVQRRLKGAPKRKRREPKDDLAATVMLQSYLDRHRASTPVDP